MTIRKRILLSAFECNPCMGSDAEVGWQWARQLARRGYDVTVITRTTHRVEIEQGIAESGDCAGVHFEYIDIAWFYPCAELVNPRNHIYYYFWQWVAYLRAKRLHAEQPFDLIHHVTWVSFRQPSFMGLVGAPLYFGPVAGGDEIPRGYARSFTRKQRLIETFRGMVNAMVRFDPLMRMTFTHANTVFFTSEAHLARVPRFVQQKARIELAIGCDLPAEQDASATSMRRGNRMLFVGRFLGLKGMDIGLRVYARIRQVRPDVTLTVVGDGVEREHWINTAKRLGVDGAIQWRGWLSKVEVMRMYAEFDLFFFPSLRDSGGFVVLEALQQGLPVVCFKLGGPGELVDDSCGRAVHAGPDIEQTIADYAAAVLDTLARGTDDPQLFGRCRQRAELFSWDALIARIYQGASGGCE